MSDDKQKKSFWQRLRFRYRVSVLNENTFDEVFGFRMSKLTFWLVLFFVFGVFFAISSALLVYTPLRVYMPGYVEDNVREEMIASSMRVDSIAQEIELQSQYVNIVKGVLAGDVKTDSVAVLDTVEFVIDKKALLQENSALLEEFMSDYEEKEKYDLNLFVGQVDVGKVVFFKPCSGVVIANFDAQNEHYGVDLSVAQNSSISAVLAGVVIYSDYTFDNGWSIMLQHDNDYVSVYRGNSRLLKRAGDEVKAGEIIAMSNDVCIFELWQKGKSIDPATVIPF
ncbi:MAG: M23 family metallopeptidase [Paludibacteraceae bacterium]|nr:M23 family metallopeptidase [Paludibacteraceae bacterium]